jgi:hypothetical protein
MIRQFNWSSHIDHGIHDHVIMSICIMSFWVILFVFKIFIIFDLQVTKPSHKHDVGWSSLA